MTSSQRISEFLIRLLYPVPASGPVHFKTKLIKASRVLVSCRTVDPSSMELISNIAALFPRKSTVVLIQHPENRVIDKKPGPVLPKSMALTPIKESFWHITRSEQLKSLTAHRFELFIDLDPEFSLLNCFLARRLKTPLRLGFKKPGSNRYYNLEYNGVSKQTVKNLEGLYQFLKSFF